MSIPLTAKTYDWSPPCFAEAENPPSFTFKHATRLDKTEVQFLVQDEGLMRYSDSEIRKAVIEELRVGWTSEKLPEIITKIEALWHARGELELARKEYTAQVLNILADTADGETPELPAEPELEFDAREAEELDMIIDDVYEQSRRVARMASRNRRFSHGYPRVILRQLLKGSTLQVDLVRAGGLVEAESAEELLEALEAAAIEAGLDYGTATRELLIEVQSAMFLNREEVKNSSAPRSGSTNRKSSATKNSSSANTTRSKTRKNSAAPTGKKS